jgi:hypothetical protein
MELFGITTWGLKEDEHNLVNTKTKKRRKIELFGATMHDQRKSTTTRNQDQKKKMELFGTTMARLKDQKEHHRMNTKTKRRRGPKSLEQQQQDRRRRSTTARDQDHEKKD